MDTHQQCTARVSVCLTVCVTHMFSVKKQCAFCLIWFMSCLFQFRDGCCMCFLPRTRMFRPWSSETTANSYRTHTHMRTHTHWICYSQGWCFCWGKKEAVDEILVLNDDVKCLFMRVVMMIMVMMKCCSQDFCERNSPRVVTDASQTHSVRITHSSGWESDSSPLCTLDTLPGAEESASYK